MEETLLHEIFGVSKSYRSTKTEVRHGGVFVAVEPREKLYRCPECGSREVIRKGKRIRRVQTLPIGFHPVYLEVAVPRCQCNTCGQILEIAPPFARLTRTTRKR
jgi:transposase